VHVVGWAFSTPGSEPVEFALRGHAGVPVPPTAVRSTQRPEVQAEHPGAPLDCGYELTVPDHLRAELDATDLLVRLPGWSWWESTPVARTPGVRAEPG
jgi:hypothetical protein